MLRVEDGQGLPDANSYVSVLEAEDIAALFGLSWPAGVDIDTTLINATDYLDSKLSPVGCILDITQSLNFPRKPFYDKQGRLIEDVPDEIKKAVVFLAVQDSNQSLFEELPGIISQRFGDSSETYSGTFRSSKGGSYVIRRLVALGYGATQSGVVTLWRA